MSQKQLVRNVRMSDEDNDIKSLASTSGDFVYGFELHPVGTCIVNGATAAAIVDRTRIASTITDDTV